MATILDSNRQSQDGLQVSYDPSVDVLHVALRGPCDVEGEGLDDGVELDFSAADGTPCGLTVIGYRQNGWPRQVDKLAAMAAAHLALDKSTLANRIRASTSG